MKLATERVHSPIGTIILVAEGDRLVSLDFEGFERRMHRLLAKRYGAYELVEATDPAGAASMLQQYFDGRFDAFDRLKVDGGGTDFQRRVWGELRAIPAGQTRRYGDLARGLGSPGASRAVGRANGLNPIAIIVPCHRVIGADRTLTGYAGGTERKDWLLRHECAGGS